MLTTHTTISDIKELLAEPEAYGYDDKTFSRTGNTTEDSTTIESVDTENLAIGDKVTIVDSNGDATQINESITLTEDFADDTGFTYDSDKSEFSGGQVQQKNQVPAGSTFGASYTSSINGNFGDGVLTGTAYSGAVISGNRLDLNNGYVLYDADLNADFQQVGAIKCKWTPKYTGAPAATQYICTIQEGAASAHNRIRIYHTDSLLYWSIADSVGGSIVSQAESFSPVADTTYEIELNFDITTGATRLFIDGVQLGTTHTGTGTRDSDIEYFKVGDANSDAYVEDLIVFNTVQHTANYTSGYTVPENIYSGDIITLPTLSSDDISSFTSISSTESNSPRYIINGLYYNSGWVASSDTWSTASPIATILANITTLPASDSIIIDVVTNDGESQMSVGNIILSAKTLTAYVIDNEITSIGDDSIVVTTAIPSDNTGLTLKINRYGVDVFEDKIAEQYDRVEYEEMYPIISETRYEYINDEISDLSDYRSTYQLVVHAERYFIAAYFLDWVAKREWENRQSEREFKVQGGFGVGTGGEPGKSKVAGDYMVKGKDLLRRAGYVTNPGVVLF